MTGEPKRQPGDGQTRRRGAALEEAILRAAADELTESGYAGLTMDRVAQRAGTNKNTIYRRWPNRLALGIAAYRQLTTTIQPPDTGTLRGDALELLRRANRHWSSPSARSCATCCPRQAARRNCWPSCPSSPPTR
ncbi:TetR/AcrR family transcriptional regulator [Thermocatellispora tengchongensis]|uniref:TetR/AcrR family transcriptional regulator n=1 Tax=Thermocatellispora tengchongensis TaxID=1073253 RepID=UPI003641B18D